MNKLLKLNGAGPNYTMPVAVLVTVPAAARICAGLNDLWKLKAKENISDDRFKALLEGYAKGVKLMAPEVTHPRDQLWVRTAFSTIYSKIHTDKSVKMMLEQGAKKTDLADILAAFGGTDDGKGKVSEKTQGIFQAAIAWGDHSSVAETAR